MKKILILLLGLLSLISLRAQNHFHDGVIYVLRNEWNDQTVTLSFENPIPDACYKWEGYHINGEGTTPTITANPQGESLLYDKYTCQCFTGDAVITQEFNVKVIDTVQIFVTPRTCLQRGQDLSLEDFEIRVFPDAYKDLVDFFPRKIPDVGLSGGVGVGYLDLTFFLDVDDRRFEKTTRIEYIDPNHVSNDVAGINANNILETIKKVKKLKIIDGANTVLERLNTMLGKTPDVGISPLKIKKPVFNFGELSISGGKYQCCNNNKVGLVPIVWDGVSIVIGADGTFTWPTPVPGLLALMKAAIGASFTIGRVELDYSSDFECFSASVGMSLNATTSFGIGVSIMNPDIISAYVSAEGNVSVMGSLSIPQMELSNPDLILTVKLKATVEVFFGIFEDHYEWNFFQIKF